MAMHIPKILPDHLWSFQVRNGLKTIVTDVEIIEADRKNTLSWTIPENATGVVILRHSAPVTDKPVDGTTYIANDTIGSATVVYTGTGTNFVDSGLTNNTTYYYAIHSYDTNYCLFKCCEVLW